MIPTRYSGKAFCKCRYLLDCGAPPPCAATGGATAGIGPAPAILYKPGLALCFQSDGLLYFTPAVIFDSLLSLLFCLLVLLYLTSAKISVITLREVAWFIIQIKAL